MQTEMISSDEVTRYLGLISNAEILGMESGRYTCFGAFDDEKNKGAGVLVAEVLMDSIRIERIYVSPEYRRKGIAKELFHIVTDLPENMKQPIIAYGVENEINREFLEAMGFHEIENGYSCLEGKLGDYQKLPLPLEGSEYSLVPAEGIAANALNNFVAEMQKEKHMQMPALFMEYDTFPDGSVVCIKNKEIAAVLLLEEADSNVIIPFVFGKDNKAILFCFSALREELIEEYGSDARLRFLLNKGKGREAIEKIVKDMEEKKILIYRQ